MDHPDITHAEQTGYPEGGEPKLWTGQVFVVATFVVDITPTDGCYDAEVARVAARLGVAAALRAAVTDRVRKRKPFNELLDLVDIEATKCERTNEDDE